MTRMFVPPPGAGVRNQPVFERQVEAHVLRRINTDPYGIPAKVYQLIQEEGGEAADVVAAIRAESDTPAARAGITSARVPGVRDPVDAGHPIHRQLIAGPQPIALSGSAEADWPEFPVGREEIRRAVLRRWRPLVARGADLDRLYAGDAAYDADHSSDELMQQAHDVDLAAFIELLVDLEALDPVLLRVAWRRDVEEVERLIKRYHNQLPTFARLTAIRDLAERVLTALTIFWEWERGFEFLRAAAGATRRTHLTLGAALNSTTALTAAFAANSRDGRYLVDGWMHFLPLQELIEVGPGKHPACSPWLAYGPSGVPAAVNHHAGLGGSAGHATLARANSVVAPFVRYHAHRQVQEVAPAAFVWGWDPLSLALAIPLQIASTRPRRMGQRNGRTAEFVPSHYGAIGRLGILVLGSICPETAMAVLIATTDAPRSGLAGEGPDPADAPLYGPASLDDVIANPETWNALKRRTDMVWASPREQRSTALGPFAFDNTVRQVKTSLNCVIPSGPNKPGYELGFHPPAWRSSFDPRPNLRDAARRVPHSYEERLPACFRKLSDDVREFCIDMAAEVRPGKTPDADDPAYLYILNAGFASGQLGTCGEPRTIVRSAVLAGKADQLVALAREGTTPALDSPTTATLKKRAKRKTQRSSRRRERGARR